MSEEFRQEDDSWDEFKWEEYLKKQDEEAARLSRFVDEHKDDPDLESLIAHELGLPEEELGEEEDEAEYDDPDEGEGWKAATGYSAGEPAEVPEDEFRSDPLYRKAFDFAIDAVDWLQRMPDTLRDDSEIQEAFSQALLPAAKIANAFDDGNDDPDMLAYRVANYKRGLACANRSLELMARIRERGILDDTHLMALENLGTEVRNDLAIRVLEIRNKSGL